MRSIKTLYSLIALALTISACGEPHRATAERYTELVQDMLIAKGICSHSADCQKKELVFREGGEINLGFLHFGGVYVNLYATQDATLVEAIAKKLKVIHQQEQPRPKLIFTVYSSTHLEPKVKFQEITFE